MKSVLIVAATVSNSLTGYVRSMRATPWDCRGDHSFAHTSQARRMPVVRESIHPLFLLRPLSLAFEVC